MQCMFCGSEMQKEIRTIIIRDENGNKKHKKVSGFFCPNDKNFYCSEEQYKTIRK